ETERQKMLAMRGDKRMAEQDQRDNGSNREHCQQRVLSPKPSHRSASVVHVGDVEIAFDNRSAFMQHKPLYDQMFAPLVGAPDKQRYTRDYYDGRGTVHGLKCSQASEHDSCSMLAQPSKSPTASRHRDHGKNVEAGGSGYSRSE